MDFLKKQQPRTAMFQANVKVKFIKDKPRRAHVVSTVFLARLDVRPRMRRLAQVLQIDRDHAYIDN